MTIKVPHVRLASCSAKPLGATPDVYAKQAAILSPLQCFAVGGMPDKKTPLACIVLAALVFCRALSGALVGVLVSWKANSFLGRRGGRLILALACVFGAWGAQATQLQAAVVGVNSQFLHSDAASAELSQCDVDVSVASESSGVSVTPVIDQCVSGVLPVFGFSVNHSRPHFLKVERAGLLYGTTAGPPVRQQLASSQYLSAANQAAFGVFAMPPQNSNLKTQKQNYQAKASVSWPFLLLGLTREVASAAC